MPIDPLNYKNPSDYLQAYQQDPRYKSQTPEMQHMLNDTALERFNSVKKIRAEHDSELEKEYNLEYKGGTIPGAGARSWWIQNVNKPSQRLTETALGGLFGGPQEMSDVWNRPGDHPLLRTMTEYIPFFGAGTPEQQAMDAWMLLMNPAFKAVGLAAEGGTVASQVWRGIGQVGTSMGVGAAAYTPKAVAEGNPWAIAEGAGQGGILGLANVAGGLFGRSGENKVYTQGVGDTLERNIPGGVTKDVKTVEDLARTFHLGAQTTKQSIVSGVEKQTGERLAASTDKIMNSVGDQPYDWTFTQEEADALGRAKIKPRGAQLAPRSASTGVRGQVIAAIPEHTYRFPSIREAYNMVTDFEREGWTTYGELRDDAVGVARGMRETSTRLFDGLYNHVDNLLGQTGDAGRWYLDHYSDKNARLYSHIFQTKGVIEGDYLMPRKLQEMVTERYWKDILENGARLANFNGENPGLGFIKSVFRGAPPHAAKDVAGKVNMFMSIHPTGILASAINPVAGLLRGFRIGGYPTMPYKAGQVAYEAGLTKMIMQMAFKVGANGMYHAMIDQLDPGDTVAPTP